MSVNLPESFGKHDETTKEEILEAHRNCILEVNSTKFPEGEDDSPTTHEVILREHTRTVTALAIDPAGARIVTGSRDSTIKVWDFTGFGARPKPFRSLIPYDQNPVRDVAFSLSGDRILVATAVAHPKIYDRDGFDLAEFPKGDQYLRDMKNTKGHASALSMIQWHPVEDNMFMTCGHDSTVRIWDAKWKFNNKQVLVLRSKNPGGRTAITSATYSRDGKYIAAAGQDGMLWIYDAKGAFIKPSHSLEKAHLPGSGASGVSFSVDGFRLASRGLDDTIKLWDLRNFKKPINTQEAMNMFEESNIIFSPDNRYIVSGVSIKKNENKGRVLLMDSSSLEIIKDINVGTTSVVKVCWHPKINQIACGTGDGTTHVLYNPESSARGAIYSVGKKLKKVQADDFEFSQTIFTIADGQDEFNIKRALDYKPLDVEVRDSRLTRKPEEGGDLIGPRKGRMASGIMAHLIAKVMEHNDKDLDPREQILKYAKKAEEDPHYIAPAYLANQPKNILADKVYENELEARIDSKKVRRA